MKVSSSDLKFHLRPVKKNQIPFNTDCGDSADTSSAPRGARASIRSVISSALRQQLTQIRLGQTQTFRLRGTETGQAPNTFVRGALSNSNPRKHSHPSVGGHKPLDRRTAVKRLCVRQTKVTCEFHQVFTDQQRVAVVTNSVLYPCRAHSNTCKT